MSADGTDKSVDQPPLKVDPASFDAILAQASDIIIAVEKDCAIRSLRLNPRFMPQAEGLRHWIGRDLRDVLTRESVEKFETRILGRFPIETVSIQLNHLDRERYEFPVEYTVTSRGDTGELLLLGRHKFFLKRFELRRLHLEAGELVAQLTRHVRLCDEQPLLQDHAEIVRRRRVARDG